MVNFRHGNVELLLSSDVVRLNEIAGIPGLPLRQ
jgi:hypothetical protein